MTAAPRKRGRRAMVQATRVEFMCPGELADYAYQLMRERRLMSVAEAFRAIVTEHRQWNHASNRVQ